MFQTFPIAQPRWLWKPWLVCQLLALLLMGSWLFEPTRAWWDALDVVVFNALNGLIPQMTLEQAKALAIMCHKRFDLAAAVVIVLLSLWPGLLFPRGRTWRYAILLFGLFGCIVLLAGNNLGIFHRWSPSLAMDPVHVLPDVGFHTKTRSRDSFPGNHGMVLMAWVLYTWLFAQTTRAKWTAVAIATILFLPRMTVGAHWLTDNLVGGSSVALVFIAWVCFTPLRVIPVYLADLVQGAGAVLLPRWVQSPKWGQ